MKQHQLLAINKATKAKNYRTITDLHQLSKKSDLFKGLRRRFKPVGDDEDPKVAELKAEHPDVDKHVSNTVTDILSKASDNLSEMWNLEISKDIGNTKSVADIILNEETENPIILIKGLPVTAIIYLEKQLDDLFTFIKQLPVLPVDKKWTIADGGIYEAEVETTARVKKVNEVIRLHDGNDKHPPQSEIVSVDKTVGSWQITNLSGEISADKKSLLEKKVSTLIKAVKSARERANSSTEVEISKHGKTLIDFVFND